MKEVLKKRKRIAFGGVSFPILHFLGQFLILLFSVSSGMLIRSGMMFFDVLSMPEVSWSDPDENWEKLFFMFFLILGPKFCKFPKSFKVEFHSIFNLIADSESYWSYKIVLGCKNLIGIWIHSRIRKNPVRITNLRWKVKILLEVSQRAGSRGECFAPTI